MERGYSLKQVSELLGITLRTAREWVRRGVIQAQKINGTNRWIVMESEVRRLQGVDEDK